MCLDHASVRLLSSRRADTWSRQINPKNGTRLSYFMKSKPNTFYVIFEIIYLPSLTNGHTRISTFSTYTSVSTTKRMEVSRILVSIFSLDSNPDLTGSKSRLHYRLDEYKRVSVASDFQIIVWHLVIDCFRCFVYSCFCLYPFIMCVWGKQIIFSLVFPDRKNIKML